MTTLTSTLTDLHKDLEQHNQDCKDVVVDLRFIKFQSDDDEQCLVDSADGTKYLFKASQDSGDETSTHALKQLCKMVGVPFTFFQENRPPVRESLVNNWLKATAPKEGEETLFLIRVREGQGVNVIRAILPVTCVPLSNEAVVKAISNYPEDINIDLDSVVGGERDALVFQARLVYEVPLEGEEYYPGVIITNSEVGASDLIIDLYLIHKESKACMAAEYGGKPFAKIQYSGVQPAEALELLNSIPSRLKEEAPIYLESIKEYEGSFPTVERACVLLSNKKGVPKKFKRSIHLEATECHDDMGTLKDFLRHAGLVAKAYDYSDRLKIERAAGSFGGLAYSKK